MNELESPKKAEEEKKTRRHYRAAAIPKCMHVCGCVYACKCVRVWGCRDYLSNALNAPVALPGLTKNFPSFSTASNYLEEGGGGGDSILVRRLYSTHTHLVCVSRY